MTRVLNQLAAIALVTSATCAIGSALTALYMPGDYENVWLQSWASRATMGMMFSLMFAGGPAVLVALGSLAVPQKLALGWQGAVATGLIGSVVLALVVFLAGATLTPGLMSSVAAFLGYGVALWLSVGLTWLVAGRAVAMSAPASVAAGA